MKKFKPENWHKILSDLYEALGSDEAIIQELKEIVDLPPHQITAITTLRLGGSMQVLDIYDTVGRAVRYLHAREKEREKGQIDKIITVAPEQAASIAKRQFIRHPLSVPIKVWRTSKIEEDSFNHQLAKQNVNTQEMSQNISLGGLAFSSITPWVANTLVSLRIDIVEPVFETVAKVAWCRSSAAGSYEVGLKFLNPHDLEEARMVEQICHIENYRRELEKNGRNLSIEDAAVEWITEHGHHIPMIEDVS